MASIPYPLDIKLPLVPKDPCAPQPIRVTTKSPARLRRAVFEIARLFRIEFSYDFTQYEWRQGHEEENHVAFLWTNPRSRRHDGKVECIGASCFRFRRYTDAPPEYVLQWIWFHPYCRNLGLLSAAWPGMKQEFGDGFLAETPLSNAMINFLVKHEHYKNAEPAMHAQLLKLIDG